MPLGKAGIEFDVGKNNIRIYIRSSSERMFACCFYYQFIWPIAGFQRLLLLNFPAEVAW
jgi:hypothetical protein